MSRGEERDRGEDRPGTTASGGTAETPGTAGEDGEGATGTGRGADRPGDDGRDDPPGEAETVRLDARPSGTGTAIAGLVGFVAVAAQAPGGPAVAVGGVGLVALVGGLRQGARRIVSLGVLGLLVGVLVAGAVGLPTELLLVSAAASAVAWDVADQAVSLGEQVGRRADTARAEFVHAAGSALVATVAVAAAYLVFRTVAGGPVLALALLLLGAILLASVLRG